MDTSPQQPPKRRILWVEDDSVIVDVLSKKLANSDIELVRANHGEDAIEMLKNMIPDGIVVDLLLIGGMTGFEFLQRIATDPRLKPIPKIVLSNLSKSEDWEKVRVLGARKFLVKSTMSLEQISAELTELVKKV